MKYGLIVVDVWRGMVFKAPVTTDEFGMAMENLAHALANPAPVTQDDHRWVYQCMLWGLDFVDGFYTHVDAGFAPEVAYQKVKDQFYCLGTSAAFIDFFELAQGEAVEVKE